MAGYKTNANILKEGLYLHLAFVNFLLSALLKKVSFFTADIFLAKADGLD